MSFYADESCDYRREKSSVVILPLIPRKKSFWKRFCSLFSKKQKRQSDEYSTLLSDEKYNKLSKKEKFKKNSYDERTAYKFLYPSEPKSLWRKCIPCICC